MSTPVPMYGFGGGGGAALNFDVVDGTTEPSNPKENTILVNTDKEITDWHFASEQPENMKEGEVWFRTGAASEVKFNALKKNNVTVYPISAKQMVSGTLTDVTVKSYQNGAWVDWIPEGYLIKEGKDCTGITGGWKAVAKAVTSSYTAKAPSFEFTGENFVISLSGTKVSGVCEPVKTIKLKGTNEICRLKVNVTGDPTNSTATVYVAPVGTAYFEGNSKKLSVGGAHDYVDLDLSGATSGEYRVYFGVWNYNTNSTQIYVSELYVGEV